MSKLDADVQKLSRAMDFTHADTIRFLATRRHFAVAMDFLHSVSDKRYPSADVRDYLNQKLEELNETMNRTRAKYEEYLALAREGKGQEAIADALGLKESSLRVYLSAWNSQGWPVTVSEDVPSDAPQEVPKSESEPAAEATQDVLPSSGGVFEAFETWAQNDPGPDPFEELSAYIGPALVQLAYSYRAIRRFRGPEETRQMLMRGLAKAVSARMIAEGLTELGKAFERLLAMVS